MPWNLPFIGKSSSAFYVPLAPEAAESCAVEPAAEVLAHPPTQESGLNRYLHHIVQAQGFEPDRNSVCNPSTVYQCLVAGQMIANPKIGKALADYLSPDVAHNRRCLVAHDEMMQAMAGPQLQFQQGVVAVLKRSDPMASTVEADVQSLPHAKAIRCDFAVPGETADAARRVKDYVSAKTDGFVRACPHTGDWGGDIRFSVTAVVHLIAKWQQAFDPKQTNLEKFHVGGTAPKLVEMMSQCEARGALNEKWGNGYCLLFARRFVSAAGQPLTMLYALPQKNLSPYAHKSSRAHLLARLADGGMESLKLRSRTIDEFKVPKFDFTQTRDIDLPGIGAFVGDSGGSADLKQIARFQHNEDGVRAAAAARFAVAEGGSCRASLRIVLNRPFDAFVIPADGSVLFALHVNDPT